MFSLEYINYIYSLIYYIFFFKIIIGLYILQVLVCKQKEEKEIDHEDDNGPIYYDNEDHLNNLLNFVLDQLYAKKQIEFVSDGNNDFCDYKYNVNIKTQKMIKNTFS